jgi:hypothetical protein
MSKQNNWDDAIYCAPNTHRINALMAEFNRAADRFFERKGMQYASWSIKDAGIAAIAEAKAKRKAAGLPIDPGEPLRDALEKRGDGAKTGG